MTEHAQPSYGKYLAVWIWLIALLAAGTFISTLPIRKTEAVLLILGVSLVKTALVALFYMHLKFERSVPLWVVVVFPFFLIGSVVLLVLSSRAFS